MQGITVLGLIAGGLTTSALVPQAHKIWKHRSARDLSLGMFIVMCTGVALWLLYGILKGEPAIIITNAASLLLGISILIMKIKFG